MSKVNLPRQPGISAAVARKGAIPTVLLAALTSPFAYTTLERWEGNVLQVYDDHLAGGLPTYCAGRTDRSAVVGAKLTADARPNGRCAWSRAHEGCSHRSGRRPIAGALAVALVEEIRPD